METNTHEAAAPAFDPELVELLKDVPLPSSDDTSAMALFLRRDSVDLRPDDYARKLYEWLAVRHAQARMVAVQAKFPQLVPRLHLGMLQAAPVPAGLKFDLVVNACLPRTAEQLSSLRKSNPRIRELRLTLLPNTVQQAQQQIAVLKLIDEKDAETVTVEFEFAYLARNKDLDGCCCLIFDQVAAAKAVRRVIVSAFDASLLSSDKVQQSLKNLLRSGHLIHLSYRVGSCASAVRVCQCVIQTGAASSLRRLDFDVPQAGWTFEYEEPYDDVSTLQPVLKQLLDPQFGLCYFQLDLDGEEPFDEPDEIFSLLAGNHLLEGLEFGQHDDASLGACLKDAFLARNRLQFSDVLKAGSKGLAYSYLAARMEEWQRAHDHVEGNIGKSSLPHDLSKYLGKRIDRAAAQSDAHNAVLRSTKPAAAGAQQAWQKIVEDHRLVWVCKKAAQLYLQRTLDTVGLQAMGCLMDLRTLLARVLGEHAELAHAEILAEITAEMQATMQGLTMSQAQVDQARDAARQRNLASLAPSVQVAVKWLMPQDVDDQAVDPAGPRLFAGLRQLAVRLLGALYRHLGLRAQAQDPLALQLVGELAVPIFAGYLETLYRHCMALPDALDDPASPQ